MQNKDELKNVFLAEIGLEKLLQVYIKYEKFIIKPDDYKIEENPNNLLVDEGFSKSYR